MSKQLRVAVGPIHERVERRTVVVALILLFTIVTFSVLSLMSGPMDLGVADVLNAVAGAGEATTEKVVQTVRLPRAITAVAVGMALGASGCIFQSISRNALGSPDIIGFTTGAATGAVIQIVYFNAGGPATSAAAVCAGVITAAVVYWLARADGQTGGYRLVLVGIGVSAFVGALNTLVLARGNIDLAVKARIWLSGSLNARTWDDAYLSALAVIIIIPILIACARSLDVVEMGDEQATQLGARPERIRQIAMFASVILTSAAVATAGPIAFVALASPQLAARLTRGSRVQVVCSALTGAALLLASDLVSVNLPVTIAMPVGLTTGLLGGIYLLWLLTRTKGV
ncbi:FecCD family ABC transporter permease [Ancrocorticia populi]|uniref:FecCD family ABC transporter permease n=2 Tax=Ancrocorticia populi TaxID=2175228 RepID=UPI0023530AF4|nr:iron chelate uptake ABC transporter family permease subunit [Ancrocorticia populi]